MRSTINPSLYGHPNSIIMLGGTETLQSQLLNTFNNKKVV
jgi:hypothetical protein